MALFKIELEDALVAAVKAAPVGMFFKEYAVISRRSPVRAKSIRVSLDEENEGRAMGQSQVVLLLEATGEPERNEAELEFALRNLPQTITAGTQELRNELDDYTVERGEVESGMATDELRATLNLIP